MNLIRVMPAKGQEHSMANSIFLAKLIGPVCLVIGIALLIVAAAPHWDVALPDLSG